VSRRAARDSTGAEKGEETQYPAGGSSGRKGRKKEAGTANKRGARKEARKAERRGVALHTERPRQYPNPETVKCQGLDRDTKPIEGLKKITEKLRHLQRIFEFSNGRKVRETVRTDGSIRHLLTNT